MSDRHKFGGGKIFVEKRILNDYLKLIGISELPKSDYELTEVETEKPVERINELENEKVNLVQILGQAKGLGDYSNNKKVKVIREVNGQPIELLIDMTDIIAATEYNITLQSKDIVYVEPNKNKSEDSFLKKATPIASLITGAAVLLSVLTK